jgi:hypothetical protein
VTAAHWLVTLAASVGACASLARAHDQTPTLTIDRGELVLTTPDGRELRSAGLVGAILEVGGVLIRLDAVEPDPLGADRALLHHFVVIPRAGKPYELCSADSSGHRWAMPVPSERMQVELVCSSGAIGKCIRWGYAPWPTSSGKPTTRELHDACVRMVRADYGGDGATATRDGTWIAFCDRAGIRPCSGGALDLEAAWSSAGAACVARPRIAGLMTIADLAQRYPHLVGHLGAACTFAAAAADDRVVLFSWSARGVGPPRLGSGHRP